MEDFRCPNLLRDLIAVVHTLWESEGVMRDNMHKLRLLELRCGDCQGVLFTGDLPEGVREEPDRANRGRREFAGLAI